MVIKPVVTALEVIAHIEDGMTVLVPGFLACGTPETLVDALVAAARKNLTAVCNDSAYPDRGIGKLIRHGCLGRFITTHQGTNRDMKNRAGGVSGEIGPAGTATAIEVELVPQGTLIERLRAGGAGLGGVLTPTGLGTPVEEGKQKIAVKGREYLLEVALRGDVALIRAETADQYGNLIYRNTARNFNPVMATAADFVIAEVARVVEPGAIDPNRVETPGIFVDRLVIRSH